MKYIGASALPAEMVSPSYREIALTNEPPDFSRDENEISEESGRREAPATDFDARDSESRNSD